MRINVKLLITITALALSAGSLLVRLPAYATGLRVMPSPQPAIHIEIRHLPIIARNVYYPVYKTPVRPTPTLAPTETPAPPPANSTYTPTVSK